jgi:glycosyltransferase involved in cell wall biosynthesis
MSTPLRLRSYAEERWTRTLIGELGLDGQAVLHGELRGGRGRDDLLARLSRLHLYVQCSAFEGLPNALLEAAACGVPLVATAVGGMREILRHEESALLVPHGDPDALAAAIGRVLCDDALAERLSRGSLTLADRLSDRREREAWLDLYRRLLAPREASGAVEARQS